MAAEPNPYKPPVSDSAGNPAVKGTKHDLALAGASILNAIAVPPLLGLEPIFGGICLMMAVGALLSGVTFGWLAERYRWLCLAANLFAPFAGLVLAIWLTYGVPGNTRF